MVHVDPTGVVSGDMVATVAETAEAAAATPCDQRSARTESRFDPGFSQPGLLSA